MKLALSRPRSWGSAAAVARHSDLLVLRRVTPGPTITDVVRVPLHPLLLHVWAFGSEVVALEDRDTP